jgi:hypothetical protein
MWSSSALSVILSLCCCVFAVGELMAVDGLLMPSSIHDGSRYENKYAFLKPENLL